MSSFVLDVYFYFVVIILTEYYVWSITINMPSSIKGTLGNYPTNLTCDYSIQNFDDIIGIRISKENTTSGSIEDLVYFRLKAEPIFINGNYLLNRTIIKGITEMSPIPTITFTLLECSDEGVYHCRFKYYTSSGDKEEEGSTSLIITNDPSVPDKISYFTTASSSKKSGIGHTTNCSSSDELLEEGDNVVIMCKGNVGRPAGDLIVQKIQNNGAVYNLTAERSVASSLDNCSFYHKSTFTVILTAEDNGGHLRCAEERFIHMDRKSVESGSLDVKYQVRTPVINEYLKDKGSLPILLTCSSIGNPSPEYAWYRITNSSQPETWKLFANGTQNITLTSVSDNGLYRCDVSNSIGCSTYRKNTTWNIILEDHSLRITKMPDQTKYTEGTSIQLTCFSLDYPSGIYRWLLPDTTVFNGSLYTIYNAKKSQSGVYTCLLIFKFTMEPSIQFITEELLIGVPETTSFQCATSSNVTAIIGSVSGTLGLCLGIFGVFYLWRRSKLKMSGSDHGRQMTTITTDYASNNYEGMGEDNTVHHYDDLRIRQEQQYYNTPVKTRR